MLRVGRPCCFFDCEKSWFALTTDFDKCILAKEKDITVYNTDDASVLYSYHNYSPVASVALNEDGSYAAYSTDNGNIYILERDDDGYNQKEILFGSDFEGKTLVSAMKGDRCVIYDESQSYMYNIEVDEIEKFTDCILLFGKGKRSCNNNESQKNR